MSSRRMAWRLLRVCAGAGAVAAASLAGVGLVGAQGGDADTLHGCVDLGTRTLRLAPASGQCFQERPLEWRQGGIPGPSGGGGTAGPAGPAGPAGAPGAAGGAGRGLGFETVTQTRRVSAEYRATSSFGNLQFPAGQAVSVLCPEGSYAVGGGFSVDSAARARVARVHTNEGMANMRGWRAEVTLVNRGKTDPQVDLSVHATCTRTPLPPTAVPVTRLGGSRARVDCGKVCAPARLSRTDVLRRGIPASVTTAGPARVRVSVICLKCLPSARPRAAAASGRDVEVGRRVASRSGRGTARLKVPLTARGKQLLRGKRTARLAVRVEVRPRRGVVRRSSAAIRVLR